MRWSYNPQVAVASSRTRTYSKARSRFPGPAPRSIRACLSLIAATAAVPALAADVTWDNGSGNLSWDTTSLNWTGAAWNNAAGDGAVFGATGAGAISVPGPINVNSISFTVNGYTLNGAGPITFVDGVSTWTTGVINVDAGANAQVNVPLNSAVGFQKIGPGVLELSAPGSYTGVIAVDPRATMTAGLLIGAFGGPLDGGTLRVMNSSVIPASTDIMFGQGYLDIGSNNQTVRNLTFANTNPHKPWDTTLNANNGVVGSGTLRVTGEINVMGQPSGAPISNSIAANVDLGGGTQIVRTGVSGSFGQWAALMFTGVVSNGSLFKTIGYNHNGVQANTDGIGFFNNNTYTGSTVLNGGQCLMAGTNATSSIKLTGAFGAFGATVLNLAGANGSAQGATVIQTFEGATLVLDNNTAIGSAGGNSQPFVPAAQNNDRIRDDVNLQFRSGAMTYRGLAATSASETFGNMDILGGYNPMLLQPNGAGGAVVLTGNNLSIAPRAAMQVQALGAGNVLGGSAQLKFSGTVPAADSTGILRRIVSNTDFLTYNASTGLTPLTTYAPDFTTPGTNVSIAASTAIASSVNINALRSTAGGATTQTIGAGQTLGINSGMIHNTGFGALTFTGGTLDFGPNPGVIFASGAVNLNGPVTGSAGLIHARGTGTYSGDFSGLTGSVDILSGTANINTNTLLSPIHNRNGTLNINVPQTAAGLGAITLGAPETSSDVIGVTPLISISGAGANAVINRDLIVDNGSTNVAGVPLRYNLLPGLSPLSNTTGSQTWSGDITLNTGLRLQGGGASASSTGATNFTGDISGPGRFFIANGRADFSGNYSNAGGFLIGDQGFSAKVLFTGVGSGNGSMLISGGNSNTMSYVAGGLQSGPISVWNSSNATAPQIIPLNDSTINNQIILGIGPKPGEEGDAIANVDAGITAEWAGPISGFSPLTKTGTGILVLSSSSSTHSGPVAVSAGTLRVNGTLPSSSVSVASGATLGGTGALSGNVTVNSGGTIAPGNGIGTATTGNISILGTLDAEIDLNNGGSALADLLNVSGNVTLGGDLKLNMLNAPTSYAGGTYLLAFNDGTDAVTGTFAAITGLPTDFFATVDYAFLGTDSLGRIGTGNDIAVSVVPEPVSLGLLALAAPLLGRRRRVV
jgi:autotransporter-associated beta strand protein